MHEKTLFPGSNTAHVLDVNAYRRYLLSFPMYPFRTLCPRDAQHLLGNNNNEFDQTSPMFPANTQLNIKFTRRPAATLLNYMLPTNLNIDLGATGDALDEGQRAGALNYTVTTVVANAPVNTQYTITGITINVSNMYLQVCHPPNPPTGCLTISYAPSSCPR